MSNPIILSDDEDLSTPKQKPLAKKPRIEFPSPINLIDEDSPTPQKFVPSSSASFVPETPFSFNDSDVAIVKCTTHKASRVFDNPQKFSGISGLICLESDNESEGGLEKIKGRENQNEIRSGFDSDGFNDVDLSPQAIRPKSPVGELVHSDGFNDVDLSPQAIRPKSPVGELVHSDGFNDVDLSPQVIRPKSPVATSPHFYRENSCPQDGLENIHQDRNQRDVGVDDLDAVKKQMHTDKEIVPDNGRKKRSKEERTRLMEEKKLLMEEQKLRKEEEKLRKAALKAEAAEAKKIEKEKKKWEKGKLASKYIMADIDTKVIEMGSVGGYMLSRFAEKKLKYHIRSNPVEGSIMWRMTVPKEISEIASDGIEIPYVLLVYEAEEFCNLITDQTLFDHVSSIQNRYPGFTICYATNKLMSFLNKRDQEQYKYAANSSGWKHPPVEEVFAKLTTDYFRVHSRQCIDEAELAEHVVGLTSSLASCQFRSKLTRLSVSANGSIIPKDSDQKLINKNMWLKALVAIPLVQPRFAIAIWKKYPTMKSLLSVYMDPSKTVHEKEFLLQDLTVEGLIGENRRLGEKCSKRIYRILMAQRGSIKTDDVELGADFFQSQT